MIKDLVFEVIQKCPNNCKFCSSNSCIEREKIIDIDTFKKAIDHLMSQGGIEEISLSGGEPMLHPDIFEMVSYCHNLGMRVVLFTSGIKRRTHLRPEDLEGKSKHEIRIARMIDSSDYSSLTTGDIIRLEENGLDKIVFDFQAATTETYGELVGMSETWTYVAGSMIKASHSRKLETDVHFVPMRPNYKELQDVVELLNIAEIRNLSILNFVPQGRGLINQKELMLSSEEMQEFKELFRWAEREFKGTIRVGIPLSKDNEHRCTAGLSKMVIKFDGKVLPCPAFKELDTNELRKHGITAANIFTGLEDVEVHPGTRVEPLCHRVYTPKAPLK